MNEKREYNGWTNWETWLVNLWLNNDEIAYNYWDGRAIECSNFDSRLSATTLLAVELEQSHTDELASSVEKTFGWITDLVSGCLQDVNWREIAGHLLEEYYEDPQGTEALTSDKSSQTSRD
tara:strand:+ start:149 stop:511 length:363 start_codon:yes stop_codon:yes gene_type:complete